MSLLVVLFVVAATPRLVSPIRIVDFGYYKDGGTIGVVLRDARGDTLRGGFDGRMQTPPSYPQHCFVGAMHVTWPGARVLPLWGKEERAFLAEAEEGLRAKFSQAERNRFLAARNIIDLGSTTPETASEWSLVRRVTRRRQTLDAIDHGGIEGEAAMNAYFESKGPFRIAKLEKDVTGGEYEVIVALPEGKTYTVFIPVDTMRVKTSPMRRGGKYAGSMVVGSLEDRLYMTLVSAALRQDPDHKQVARLLRIRTRQILADDARR